MSGYTIRIATEKDLEPIMGLIDKFAEGHPAESFPRSKKIMSEVYFGEKSHTRFLVAENKNKIVGFAAWKTVFDMLWSMKGGEDHGLFILEDYRNKGLAPMLIASLCADIRDHGGEFFRGHYGVSLAQLYEKIAIGLHQKECNLSASAFQQVADLAGRSSKEIVKGLPKRDANFE